MKLDKLHILCYYYTTSISQEQRMLDLMTTQKFSLLIENVVKDKRVSYMDAIVWWCEKNEMEIEVAAKLCNGVIKEKLRYEPEKLNFLERPARLPL
jgi:hypothetical protein